MSRTKHILGRILLLLPAIFGTTAALADDDKLYPGAMCLTARNTSVFTRDTLGRLLNTGTVPLTFICPVVKDTFTGLNQFEFAQITILGPVFPCSFITRNDEGKLPVTATPSSIVPVPGGINKLRFGDGPPNLGASGNVYAYFVCTVPPRSGVISYKVSELGG